MDLIRLDWHTGYRILHFVLLLYVSMVTEVFSTACEVCECQEEPEGLMVDCMARGQTEIPPGIPAETVILKLSSNAIESIGETDLQNLASLQYLYLDRNELRADKISPGAFDSLVNLKYFDLSDNRLQLDTNHMTSLLRPLTELVWLDLANNNIYTIEQGMVEVFQRLETLTLTATILTCDCNLLWFKNWLLNTRFAPPIVNGAECFRPDNLKRQQVAYADFCTGEGTCYQCNGASSNEECTSIQQCNSAGQTACQNEIRTSNNVRTITKGCQQLEACLDNNQMNLNECDPSSPDGACWYCCQGDLCNEPEEAVVESKIRKRSILKKVKQVDGCRETLTSTTYRYQYPWPEVPVGISMVTFKLRAKNDGHVALSSTPQDMDNVIEIVLGGWDNTKSGIRTCKQCELLVSTNTGGLLSSTTDTHFYIIFNGGSVSVGIVSDTGVVMPPFMSHRFTTLNIDHIGISTGWMSTGVWTFCGYGAIHTPQLSWNQKPGIRKHKEGSIRLAGNSKHPQGHVEIYHQRQWGYVCGANWDISSASVACRQLGHDDAVAAYSSVEQSDGSSISPSSLIRMHDVTCVGHESDLSSCKLGEWVHRECHNSLYASVVCGARNKQQRGISKDVKMQSTKREKRQSSGVSCPSGWSAHGNYCYYVSTQRTAWDTARFQCGTMDAMLTTIHDQDEQDFVTSLVKTAGSRLWIGLHDLTTEGSFEWVDGSPLDFTDWSGNQPDNENNNEHCGQLFNSGEWNDEPCTKLWKYICKKVKDCDSTALGMETGAIVDSQITASSTYIGQGGLQPWDARLNNANYWAASHEPPKEEAPWIQVDLLQNHVITGVMTQGSGSGHDFQEWITRLQIQYGESEDTLRFILENGVIKTFGPVNQDRETPATLTFPVSVIARILQLRPTAWHSWCALRFEILGCQLDTGSSDPDNSDAFCTGKSDGIYPDPQDCTNFYGCSNNGQTQVLSPCGAELVFNPYCTCCDWPRNYDCKGVSDFSCVGKTNGLYPDDDDCRSYFSCSGGDIIGRTVCNEGLVYNPGCECCDWPAQYQCPLPPSAITYLGCFEDQENRALPFIKLTSDSMTHEVCFTHCLVNGYPYAGVQYSIQCFCGRDDTDYAIYGQKDDSECSSACRGDESQTCGGNWRLNIYSIQPDFTPPVTSEVRTEPPQVTGSIPMKPMVCYEEISNEGDKGLIEWADTGPKETMTVECPYQKSYGDAAYASRRCLYSDDAGAYWEPADVEDCPTDTEILEELADEEITEDNVVEVSEMLAVVTSNPDSLGNEDVNNAVITMEHITNSIDTLNPGISPEILTNTLETVNHMIDVPVGELEESQRGENTSTRILRAVDDFALGVRFNSPSITENTQAVDMAVVNIDTDILGSTDVLFRTTGSRNTNYQSDLYLNFSTTGFNIKDDDGLLQASILLPNSVLTTVGDDLDRCQFVMFQDTTFFEVIDVGGPTSNQNTDDDIICSPSTNDDTLQGNNCDDPEEEDNEQDGGGDPDIVTILNSVVISASVGDYDVNNLDEPARITLRNINEDAFNPRCVYWDYNKKGGKGGWSQKGCTVNSAQSTDSVTVCECNHLTNFAMIMDVYKDGAELSRGHTIALSVISYIGCAVSLIALLLVILTYTVCGRGKKQAKRRDRRSGRRDKRTKILLNLVVSLILVNLFFICGSLVADYNGPDELCIAMSIILHYSLLSAMTWMALEAFDMYMALVKVFESYYSHYLLKMCIVGWGLPVVVVAVTAGINIEHYGSHSGLCWLSMIPFYAAFLAPVCLILFFNSIVFISVTKQLCDMRKRNITKSDNFNLAAQLRASFSITFLLGLTWILAIFAVGQADLTFSYMFAIVNSLQGFSLFFFQCVLNTDIRKRWYQFCCPKCAPPEDDGYPSDATSRRITQHQKISNASTTQLTSASNNVSGRVSQFENNARYNAYDSGSTNNSNGRSYGNDNTYDYPSVPPDSEVYSTIDDYSSRTTRT